MQLKSKKITVFGFSPRTGLELVKYLNKYDLEIIVIDSKNRKELKELISKVNTEKIIFNLASDNNLILESDLIILSPGVPYDLEILKKARAKGIETISEIEFAYRRCSAEIIAITGTNGKTTTTELISLMLNDLKGKKVKIAGNIGIPFISIVDELQIDDKVILELSSFQLEAVKKFKAKIALFLNYSPDHLDRHKSEKNYKKAKRNIFNNQNKNDFALIDLDDQYLYSLKNKLKAKTFSISYKNIKADLLIKNNKAIFKEKLQLIDYDKINIPGLHNKKNIAFAALTSYLAGQDIEKIQKAAENYTLQSHRMEFIKNKKDFIVIDDSKATNPDAAIKALESFDDNLILIAGGQDRDADFTQLAKTIKAKVNNLILIGETKEKIASLFLKENDLNIFVCANLEEATKIAVSKLNRDNTLLLSPGCPSWDMFESYKERGKIFKKIVLKELNKE